MLRLKAKTLGTQGKTKKNTNTTENISIITSTRLLLLSYI